MIHHNPPPASRQAAFNEQNHSGRPAIPDESPVLALKNCFFFAALLFRYPDDSVYPGISRNMTAFTGFFTTYGGRVPELPPAPVLQAEYVSLFVNNKGFVPAVPYASCHIDGGGLMGDAYFKLREKMMESGFQLDPSVAELEDHLTILLEFASHLIGLIINRQEAGEKFLTELKALSDITDNYIRPVVDAVSEKIDAHASFDFYRITAHALRKFIHDTHTVYKAVLNLP